MKIIHDEKEGVFVFIARDVEETEVLRKLIKACQRGNKLDYGGRKTNPDNSMSLDFYFGAKEKEVVRRLSECCIIIDTVHVGGIHLRLKGIENQDQNNVRALRDSCYFGSGELTFLRGTEIDGSKAIIVVAGYCKVCGGKITDSGSCEYRVCKKCADKCNHQYVHGYIHGGEISLGRGVYCELCGRVKDNENVFPILKQGESGIVEIL